MVKKRYAIIKAKDLLEVGLNKTTEKKYNELIAKLNHPDADKVIRTCTELGITEEGTVNKIRELGVDVATHEEFMDAINNGESVV